MSKKTLYMNMVDESLGGSRESCSDGLMKEEYFLRTIGQDEYKHLYLDRVIEMNEVDDAISIILTYFMQNHVDRIYVDLDDRDKKKAPAKEMTLEEVEAALGYKVKIVNKIVE